MGFLFRVAMTERDNESLDLTYRLRWDNSKKIFDHSKVFQKFRDAKEVVDVSLRCSTKGNEGSLLRAHKLVLAAYSPVFKDMFTGLDMKNNTCVLMNGISCYNMSFILDFIYQGTVDIPQSKMKTFLSVAEELQIHGLQSGSENTDSISTTNVIESDADSDQHQSNAPNMFLN